MYVHRLCKRLTFEDKYKRPDWLPGKLYTTLSVQDSLSMFAEILHLSGLDTIVDVSGSWTIFAPTDEAIKQYLADNNYASISSIPSDKLEKIAEFHIVQNPWTLEQLQILSAYGWRDEDGGNSNLYAYKRQTSLKNPNEKFWIKQKKDDDMIVLDSTMADRYKRVYVQSRKYVPVFYDQFMAVNNISSEDYQFYFGRPYENGNIYFAGAKILRGDIIAENGFIHLIDKVVSPMLNAKEMLEREIPGETYKRFLEMVYWYYPDFEPNISATYNQYSVRQGGLVDTLWDLHFSPLDFDIQDELTGNSGSTFNLTLVRHNGIFAPTDNTFGQFDDGILTEKSGFPHWADARSLPMDVVEFIIPRHFDNSPIYPSKSKYQEIFIDESRYKQNEESIIRKEFGSNCTFIGIDSYSPDKVFTSITGPVFCRPSYSTFRRALLYSNVYSTLAEYEGELYFFPINNAALVVDSSLILNWIDRDANRYNFQQVDRISHEVMGIGSSTVRNMILNQVAVKVSGSPMGKEVFRTLTGRTLTWDHYDNTIKGTSPTKIWHSGEIVSNHPLQLEEPADNGRVFGLV